MRPKRYYTTTRIHHSTTRGVVLNQCGKSQFVSKIMPLLLTTLRGIKRVLASDHLASKTRVLPRVINTILFRLYTSHYTRRITKLRFINGTIPIFVRRRHTLPTGQFQGRGTATFSITMRDHKISLSVIRILANGTITRNRNSNVPHSIKRIDKIFVRPTSTTTNRRRHPYPSNSQFTIQTNDGSATTNQNVNGRVRRDHVLTRFSILTTRSLIRRDLNSLITNGVLVRRGTQTKIHSLPNGTRDPIIVPHGTSTTTRRVPSSQIKKAGRRICYNKIILMVTYPRHIVGGKTMIYLTVLRAGTTLHGRKITLIHFLLYGRGGTMPHERVRNTVGTHDTNTSSSCIGVIVRVDRFRIISSISSMVPALAM